MWIEFIWNKVFPCVNNSTIGGQNELTLHAKSAVVQYFSIKWENTFVCYKH